MRHILAWSLAAILAMLALMGLWAQANRDPKVGNPDVTWSEMSDADKWVVCVEQSEPTDANLQACDDVYGAHDMRVLRP